MKGFGRLTSAEDLRKKLEHDFGVLQDAPGNSYAAFNFFVTAEHMLDWVYPDRPGKSNSETRKSIRKSEVLLQIVSHIASGAKHFQPTAPHHESVTRVDHRDAPYGGGDYGRGAFGGDLTIGLDGPAAANYGPTVPVVRLAELVLDYWRRQPLVGLP